MAAKAWRVKASTEWYPGDAMGMQSRITDKWNLFRKDPRDACKALFHLVW